MKRAVGYIRVSSVSQVEGESLDNQRDNIRKHCEIHGYNLTNIYDDSGYSGSNTARPDFEKMMLDASASKFDVVIVNSLSRFSRSTSDFLKAFELLQENEINLISLQDSVDTSGATGKLLITIMSAVAEWDRSNILKQTQENRLRLWKRNEIFLGQPPYGFRWDNENNKLVLYPEEIQIYKRIVDLYLDCGLSFLDIANKFNAEKIPCKSGHWSSATLSYIIKNTAYYGYYVVNTHSRKDGKPKPIEDHINYPCVAVISKERWERLQEKTKFNKIKSKKGTYSSQPYFLRDMLQCVSCGGKISHHHGSKRKAGDYKRYYSCYWSTAGPKTLENGKMDKCMLPQIDAELLENIIWHEILTYVFLNRERFLSAFSQNKDALFEDQRTIEKGIRMAKKEKNQLKQQEQKLYSLYLNDKIPEESLARAIVPIHDKIKSVDSKIEQLTEKQIQNQNLISEVDNVRNFVKKESRYLGEIAKAIGRSSAPIRKRVVEAFLPYPIKIELLYPPLNVPEEYIRELYADDYYIIGQSKDKRKLAGLSKAKFRLVPNIKIIELLMEEGTLQFPVSNSAHSHCTPAPRL